jgi:hypothetical protein
MRDEPSGSVPASSETAGTVRADGADMEPMPGLRP